MFAISSKTGRQNFAQRLVLYLCNTWAGSDVDRGHHWEENALFINAFQVAISSTVVSGWSGQWVRVGRYKYRNHIMG